MWRFQYKLSWLGSRDLFAGLHLRGTARRLRERADDRPSREIDLERVVAKPRGPLERDLRSPRERRPVGRLATERGFGLRVTPGLVRDTTQCETRFPDGAAIELEAGRDGNERERIGEPVADFEIGVVCSEPF